MARHINHTTNRNRTEITIQILEVVTGCDHDNEGSTRTKLMSKLFLSHEQTKEYLMLLLEDDLLSYDSTMSTFKTTEKGLTFLQAYNQINKILKESFLLMNKLEVVLLSHFMQLADNRYLVATVIAAVVNVKVP